MKTFCTCANKACPLHPTQHDKGCSPCIEKKSSVEGNSELFCEAR